MTKTTTTTPDNTAALAFLDDWKVNSNLRVQTIRAILEAGCPDPRRLLDELEGAKHDARLLDQGLVALTECPGDL
jgi:hypothetical protein